MTGRKQHMKVRIDIGLLSALLIFSNAIVLHACPFCSGPSRTLTEQLSESEITVLAKWIETKKGTLEKSGNTLFEIKKVIRKSDKDHLDVGGQIIINRHRSGKRSQLFLLLGTNETSMNWKNLIPITETCFQYISQAPPAKEQTSKRLRYFLKFLEHSDPMIANDAFAEFANAPYEKITPLAKELPRKKIRTWIVSPDTPVVRLGLYGLLLGLCGQESDIAFMESKINEPVKKVRFGIDGLISGYLLQTGADGLNKIEQTKFVSETVPYSETKAAIQALYFMWAYGNERISKERLRKSMRLLLDRPELTDLVIADLARWNDWSVLDRLMQMYQTEDYNNSSIKRAIIRYLLVASKGRNKKGIGADPNTAGKAKQLLKKLREKDPKTVKSAERLFIVR
ncbi:hypothetical protein [Gimesia aquarii]|uniref:Uncharacterized protein n=1 Tax=Gimesia aquarii TaxID=2527964 RepID=A0A517X372_9PLAN|nr:hypothetical protein [Gimesia aquarii]QDU11945.1 hypothetical protein V202x_53700 [Gimesia aquarii]